MDFDLNPRSLAAELRRIRGILNTQNIRFDLVLEKMRQGLCLFDGSARLIVANRRYAELYGIAPESIQPGTSLGMETTAKGVETEKQLELIRAEGCTEAQGFYFSPPRPADELAPFLGSGAEMMRPGRSGFIRRA
jgi:PAS domain-containing protein